jgi:hypothetical protein
MNTEKMTKSVVLFILSFPYALFHLFCYYASKKGVISGMDAIIIIIFAQLVYLFLPLIGLFAVKDYNKNTSKKIDICRERYVFLSLLALNVLYALGLVIMSEFHEPIFEACPILYSMLMGSSQNFQHFSQNWSPKSIPISFL